MLSPFTMALAMAFMPLVRMPLLGTEISTAKSLEPSGVILST